MFNIDIKRKETDSYQSFYVDNDAFNIVVDDDIINSRYRVTTALNTLQNIANRTIAPDAAYWQDITNRLGFWFTHPEVEDIKCCDDFIVISGYITSGQKALKYSRDCGKSWNTIDDGGLDLQSASHSIFCLPTYLGYRIGYLQNTSNTRPYENNSELINCVITYDGDEFALNKMHLFNTEDDAVSTIETPFGILLRFTNNSSSGYQHVYKKIEPFYNYEQLTKSESANWGANTTFNLVINSASSDYYDIYDETLNRLIMYSQWDDSNDVWTGFQLLQLTNSGTVNFGETITNVDGTLLVCNNALRHSFFGFGETDSDVISHIKYIKATFDSSSVWSNYELEDVPLPNNTSNWIYMFGNDYRLYMISDTGDIAYLNSVDGEWRIANQSVQSGEDTYYETFKQCVEERVGKVKAVTDKENTYIIAIVDRQILRTEVGNLQ